MNEDNNTKAYVPYSEYPVWRLREWEWEAERCGDFEFAKVLTAAIKAKQSEGDRTPQGRKERN